MSKHVCPTCGSDDPEWEPDCPNCCTPWKCNGPHRLCPDPGHATTRDL